MIKYTVYVDDDRFEFLSDKKLGTEEIAKKLSVKEESIIMVDFEDAE